MLRSGFLCAVALLSVGCDRGVGAATRSVEVSGLPACKGPYARPIVVRLDRDRSVFDEPFSTLVRIDQPAPARLTVPRTRMRATVRAGLCAPTSVATWDCAAAAWLVSTTVELDARSSAATVRLPPFEGPCSRR